MAWPDRPAFVALTGTDVYEDLPSGNAEVKQALDLADRLIVLQPLVTHSLPAHVRYKVRVIYQSSPTLANGKSTSSVWRKVAKHTPPGAFVVAVLGHLRDVKDPLRAAKAVRGLPQTSSIQVIHLGKAMDARWKQRATAEMKRNPRYLWLGEASHREALQVMLRSQLLCVTSRLEGGANVVTEAIAQCIPIVSSHMDGSVGILGEDYPGFYPVGMTKALRRLLLLCELDQVFYQSLRQRVADLKPLVHPQREQGTWRSVLHEFEVSHRPDERV